MTPKSPAQQYENKVRPTTEAAKSKVTATTEKVLLGGLIFVKEQAMAYNFFPSIQ